MLKDLNGNKTQASIHGKRAGLYDEEMEEPKLKGPSSAERDAILLI